LFNGGTAVVFDLGSDFADFSLGQDGGSSLMTLRLIQPDLKIIEHNESPSKQQ
jgi:hypothetical protein